MGKKKAKPYNVDFYSDEFILNPYPHYEKMRKLGSVIWLPKHGNFAVTRYSSVKDALKNHTVFSSAQGVAADETGCTVMRGNTVASDPPVHDDMRKAMGAPLLPGALDSVKQRIEVAADQLVESLVNKKEFDGIHDFARHLPETVVTDLVGLPEDGRENMGLWAAKSFDVLGIQNERGVEGMEVIKEMRNWVNKEATVDRLKPGSWTARIHNLADKGEIDPSLCPMLIRDYINPSLDTTISATGQLIYELGNNPEQWAMLRENRSLIPNAVNEAVRLATPIRSFSRTLTCDYELDGYSLPQGARAMMLFVSANRDENIFSNPNQFDVTREGSQHLGFGHGIHTCVGMHLARLEMEALIHSMLDRVLTIKVGQPEIALNNTIRIFSSLPVKFVALTERKPVRKPVEKMSSMAEECPWVNFNINQRLDLTEEIISLELVPNQSEQLPEFTAGAHIDIMIKPDLIRQYSLCNNPSDKSHYRIAILKDPQSRGGSATIHDTFTQGKQLLISQPRNAFELDESADFTLMFAGGIGVTPLLAMAYRLNALDKEFELHYCAKATEKLAFLDEIRLSSFADRVIFHVDNGADEQRLNLEKVLEQHAKNSHVYVCGPSGFMDYVSAACRPFISDDRFHVEYFAAEIDTAGAAFSVYAQRSKKLLRVNEGETIMQVLENAGIAVEKSCESGVCSTCITSVLSGVPDHRDLSLTEEEKMSNKKIAVCCSRSKSKRLVLDI